MYSCIIYAYSNAHICVYTQIFSSAPNSNTELMRMKCFALLCLHITCAHDESAESIVFCHLWSYAFRHILLLSLCIYIIYIVYISICGSIIIHCIYYHCYYHYNFHIIIIHVAHYIAATLQYILCFGFQTNPNTYYYYYIIDIIYI